MYEWSRLAESRRVRTAGVGRVPTTSRSCSRVSWPRAGRPKVGWYLAGALGNSLSSPAWCVRWVIWPCRAGWPGVCTASYYWWGGMPVSRDTRLERSRMGTNRCSRPPATQPAIFGPRDTVAWWGRWSSSLLDAPVPGKCRDGHTLENCRFWTTAPKRGGWISTTGQPSGSST